MKVSVLLFASVREAVGRRDLEVDLAEHATIADLSRELGDRYPQVRPMLANVVFAVDDEYVKGDACLREGSAVAVIPPVSGGATMTADLFRVTHEPLEPHVQRLVNAVRADDNGAVALFYGVVRNNSEGRAVERLEYEAYEPMALTKLREAAQATREKFPEIGLVGVWHRIGMLNIGETSLLVAVASPHRKEAFEACHWAVDCIKETVPIWKKEHWQGGGAWVEGHPVGS